ncbi:polysaccharide biosynthesis tyrosine autokinase [Rubrobacter taiwanensis]|jgi:capsular exopolysaccharide synthesis family protein|uniref:Polysaccharide biosynthesis tyrosine autokinase n=1 Tax=Rubrobacter taiwanensis TaxID=185139 RepID=A0A4R1BED9_9ACTN|nr:CpsD/CapB family tyrosine-protein kinase [Rubrobacter taiwanensis]TCJ15471.1 polysaccharide biosynthesis tyrosine autokinase [Rubrobacter taiwanensis]
MAEVAHPQTEMQDKGEGTNLENLSGELVTVFEPDGAASEAYRTVRTNLLYTFVDSPPRVVVVTSPGSAEGKSTTCANLGVALAQAGKRTLIIDCDLRRPVMHKIFGLSGKKGIVSLLAGESSLHEVCQEPLPGLKVLSAGTRPPNPAELLGSQRLADFLAGAQEEFDYVLIDSPPVRLVSDSIVLASQGDGVLLVLDAQKTRKGDLRRTVRSLKAVGAVILGTVMNNVKDSGDNLY